LFDSTKYINRLKEDNKENVGSAFVIWRCYGFHID